MRPTFLAFQTAGRALAASQANINVTGNNIANVETDGYSRQRTDQNSISQSGYTQKFANKNVSTGFGVEVSRVSQIRDPFLDARFRNQASETSMYNTILGGLGDLERVIDEASNVKLQNEISNFINQLQILTQTPTSKDIALVARTAAHKVTEMLNVYSAQINEVRDQQIHDLSKVIIDTDFNTLVKNIANLNVQIREELTHGNTPNELYDQRNTFIDQLAGIANIKVTTLPEKISEDLIIENLNISIYDEVTRQAIPIVKNGLYNTLSAVIDPSSKNMTIEMNSSFGNTHGDVTSYFSSGSIKANLDLINGSGTYAESGGNPFRGTLYYEKAVDTFAANFARVLNDLNVHPVNGSQPLFTDGDGNTTGITARNISISEEWMKDSQYIVTTESTGNTGEPDNIMKMIVTLTSDIEFYKDGAGPPSAFKGKPSEYMSGLIGELSLDYELHQNFANAANTIQNNLFAARESVSGVNLDEEGINLMAYQKSYNAAARYFTVLDEAVDLIINRMGLVGR
ncbi:MAG: flagellar hook-associated protein FlgK [Anaerovoracaceae bacterium]|jgi:flagellar hook-associated protein 1 FlgK